jgi:proline dehydrogenase
VHHQTANLHVTVGSSSASHHPPSQIALEEVKARGAEVMIATHNQESVEKALHTIRQLGWKATPSGVYFGQLLGMADHLTFTLAQNGYR